MSRMKPIKYLAYEFRDKLCLEHFLNSLSEAYKDLGFPDLTKEPLFESVSDEHPVYVLTPKGEPVYTLADKVSDEVTIVNKSNAKTIIKLLEE